MRKGVIVALIIAVLAALGWFVLRETETSPPVPPQSGPAPVPAPQTPTPTPEPAAPPMEAPRPVAIEPLSMDELQQIEAGLGCSFHQDKLMFLATNRSQAIVKGPEGIVTGPLTPSMAETLMQSGGRFKLGRYTVSVKPSADMATSGHETMAAPAVLQVSDGQRTATIDGAWECGS